MRSKALPGWAHTLCTAAAALVFLLAYELVVYRVPVTEIFLPVSSWSDEVIYSKQLAAAVQYGDLPHKGKAKPNAAHLPAAGFIHPEKAEDALRQSAGIPGPVSATRSTAVCFSCCRVTRTAPPGRLYLMPFSTRLNTSR